MMNDINKKNDVKAIVAYVALQVITRICLIFMALCNFSKNTFYLFYSLTMILAFSLLDLFLIYLYVHSTKKRLIKTLKETKLKTVSICIFKSLLLAFVFLAIEALLFMINSKPSSNTQNINQTIKINLLFFIVPIFLAPFSEEFIFRKALTNLLCLKINLPLSTIISSSVFAFFHFISDGQFFIYFIMGIYMQLIFTKWHSLTINILVHSFINLVPVITLLISYFH